jgi:N4-(beta-N-acetylglucosaminyl)-L-asparaginase
LQEAAVTLARMRRPTTRRRFLFESVAATTVTPLALACDSACGRRGEAPPSAEPLPPAQARDRNAAAERGLVLAATWEWGADVCERGAEAFRGSRSILDAIEAGVRAVELDPEVLTVGVGGLPNEDGVVELDAMIMKGSTLDAGAVASLREIATPIAVARKVMERTRHVLLVGEGAQAFALAEGLSRADLGRPEATARYEQFRATGQHPFRRGGPDDHDTVGAVGLDGAGEIVVGVSTSGLPFKMSGRVGDSPLVGAGGYADAEVGAACATGVGEEVIRTCGSFAVVEAMRAGRSPREAAEEVLRRMVRRRGAALGDAQVAFIALRRDGEIGAACLRDGFEMHVRRDGRTERVVVQPVG